MRIKCLAQGHYCHCQQIQTGDLTIESVELSTEPQQLLKSVFANLKGELHNRFNLSSEERVKIFKHNSENLMKIG